MSDEVFRISQPTSMKLNSRIALIITNYDLD